MSLIDNLIKKKTEVWIRDKKDDNQHLIKPILTHLEQTKKLRIPQTEAIETYLWIKFEGKNQKLAHLIKEGLLYDETTAKDYDGFHAFTNNQNSYTNQFLNQFFSDNNQKILQKKLVNDPNHEQIDWNYVLEQLLHNFDYPNYLYSLPMGAGKTFLMACFIYLDLYFAKILKKDQRFAHNFIVFAPHASKTAILPSLKTIKNFNPAWILPKEQAESIKQEITFEVLDSLRSSRKDKLQSNNPNLDKVNRLKQAKKFGLVFITNAEKVVLESYYEKDKNLAKKLKTTSGNLIDQRKLEDLKKTNQLRDSLSEIPNLIVILDEVHHSYGGTRNGEKKLRKAVDILNKDKNVITVLGLSGTPYVKNKIIVNSQAINLNQIQDIVYNYPLNTGIGKFLKIPEIKKANIAEKEFIKQALSDFFENYDKQYQNGTKSKIAFYCRKIRSLNEEILPTIQEWYSEHRKGKEQEIFRYYSNSTKEYKKYSLPKDCQAIFSNLDQPYSEKRVILLVEIGKEGWDCKSLTAVVLPRQKTTNNFVLQTTCRCLREVDNAATEKALIYLSADNYETLNQELKDTYKLSINDLKIKDEQTIKVQIRKPKLGKLKYKQIETKYKIVTAETPDVKKTLANFNFKKIKEKYSYNPKISKATIGKDGLVGEKEIESKPTTKNNYSYNKFLDQLAINTYGRITENEFDKNFNTELNNIYQQIEKNSKWIILHPELNLETITKIIVSSLMKKITYTKYTIEQETEIELLEWKGQDNRINFRSPAGKIYKLMPHIPENDLLGKRGFANHPENIEAEFFKSGKNVDPNDISYNYIPYKMDSEFEQKALVEILKLSKMENLEVYFNGYKNEKLQSFWIKTKTGKYTPDFLILKRDNNQKYNKNKKIAIKKVLIIETKGQTYYNDEFKAKENFVKQEFLKHNSTFKYHCFKDDGKNDFTKNLDEFRELLKELKK